MAHQMPPELRTQLSQAQMQEALAQRKAAEFESQIQHLVHTTTIQVYSLLVADMLKDYEFGEKIPVEHLRATALVARNVAPFALEACGMGSARLDQLQLVDSGEPEEPEPEPEPEPEVDGESNIVLP